MASSAIKSKMAGWRKNHPAIFFLLFFVVFIGAFYVAYFSEPVQNVFLFPLIRFYAKLSGLLLNLMGYGVVVVGDLISSPKFSIGIKQGCDAIEPMVIFLAGVLAFPVSWRKKMRGVIAGIAVLFTLNVVRIVSLFITGQGNQKLFDTMHLLVWQIVFILVAIGLLFMWLQWAARKKSQL